MINSKNYGTVVNFISRSKSYHKITLYIYLIFYFLLFCWIVKTGGDEIIVKGEDIYKTIAGLIMFLLFMPVFFVFPIGASFIFSHILYERKRKNLFVAWILSFTVVPASIIGAFFCRISFESLYISLSSLLLIIMGVSLFYSKIKWLISILLAYILYLLELYLAEFLIHV